jgi:hypothetical protein
MVMMQEWVADLPGIAPLTMKSFLASHLACQINLRQRPLNVPNKLREESTYMSITVVTNLSVLMRLARDLGQAKKSGAQVAIDEAQARHDAYKDICLKADNMATELTWGQLGS